MFRKAPEGFLEIFFAKNPSIGYLDSQNSLSFG